MLIVFHTDTFSNLSCTFSPENKQSEIAAVTLPFRTSMWRTLCRSRRCQTPFLETLILCLKMPKANLKIKSLFLVWRVVPLQLCLSILVSMVVLPLSRSWHRMLMALMVKPLMSVKLKVWHPP